MRRGEIYYADLRPSVGSEQNGIRPVLILQNELGNIYSRTFICAPLTSRKNKANLPTHIEIPAQESGLRKDSIVLLEQMRTLDKRRFKNRIGELDDQNMKRIDKALLISLGLKQDGGERKMNELQVTEHKNIRVLTTQQIAELYGTDNKTISYNFNHNKERYQEGKHYILLTGDELRAFREIHDLPNNLNKVYLWTEKGAFLHAKSLNIDKAWEVYEHLVDTYFNRKKPMSIPEQIQLLAQGNMHLEEKIDSVNKDLQEFKQDMPLLALECQKITRAKNQKVVPLMGGKDSPAYKDNSLRGKVYSDIDSQLRREFGVDTYKAIKRNQCNLAIGIINGYELPMVLAEQIEDANARAATY